MSSNIFGLVMLRIDSCNNSSMLENVQPLHNDAILSVLYVFAGLHSLIQVLDY